MAITQIKGSNIADGTVVAADVADGAVTTTKVADNAVTGAKIAMGSDAAGDVLTYNGTDYIRLAKGTAAQVLKMNAGATAVEWATDAGGIAVPGSSVRGDTLYHNGTVYTRLAKGSSGQVLTMGANDPAWAATAAGGKVLQVVSITKTDTQATTATTFSVVEFGSSPYGLAITPSATTSKIFVQLNIAVTSAVRYTGVQLFRDSTQIGMGDADGSRTRVFHGNMSNETEGSQSYLLQNDSMTFMDEPNTTSEIKYYVKSIGEPGASQAFYINRTPSNGNASYDMRGISTLTLWEIDA